MALKQMSPTVEKVGGNTFYITPFAAFKAANLTGELASTLAPLIGALAPLIGEGKGSGDEKGDNGLLDVDASKAAEVLSGFPAISGDRLEGLMRKLLLGGNIVVEITDEDTGEREAQQLDFDTANELFCGDVQDMFILCFHVIKLNFKGFFRKIAAQSGNADAAMAMAVVARAIL